MDCADLEGGTFANPGMNDEGSTGTTVDRDDLDSLSKAVNEQNQYLTHQRQADADLRKSLDRESEGYSLVAEADINTSQKAAFKDQALLQEGDLVIDKSEANQVADILDFSVDEEIEHFMQGYAAAQQMDTFARLQAEQTLLGGHYQCKQDNNTKIDGLQKQRKREVETIRRENPDADVEALVEDFK